MTGPTAEVVPVWQPAAAQVLAVGAIGFNVPAPPWNARAVRTCSWEPNNTRAASTPVNMRRIAGRHRFTIDYPLKKIFDRTACGVKWPQQTQGLVVPMSPKN